MRIDHIWTFDILSPFYKLGFAFSLARRSVWMRASEVLPLTSRVSVLPSLSRGHNADTPGFPNEGIAGRRKCAGGGGC
jgi:hypothetical protein